MPTALRPAELPTQTHQGIGARLVCRIGRVMRSAIAGGIVLTAHRRRRAAPQSGTAPACRVVAPPAPRRPRRPRPAAPVPPATPTRRGWLARWFGRIRPKPAPLAWPMLPDGSPTTFTPDAFPGLGPEARAFFNTPVEDCDPNELRIVLAVLAQQIADSVPAELGLDAKALFATLCGRLGSLPDAAHPEVPPAEEPLAPPAAPENAMPDAAPAPPVQGQGTEPADDAALAESAERGSMPDRAAPTAFVSRVRRAPCGRSRRLRHRRRPPEPRLRERAQRCRRAATQPLPPRRLCYAACAGPP